MEVRIETLQHWLEALSMCNYKPVYKVYNDIRTILKMHGTGQPFNARPHDCLWTQDGDGNWDTSCKEKFILMEGTPRDNGMRFCPYCGKELYI